MNLIDILKRRHAAKAYDPARRIPPELVEQLMESLRLSPSSVNSQPWHFIVADDAAGKSRIAKSTIGMYAYNAPKVLDASHVVVLCSRDELSPEHLQAVLAQEGADARFTDDEGRERQRNSRAGFVRLHEELGDTRDWMQKQTYIAQGFLLLAAGLLGVDATPMEGFDAEVLAAEFDLQARGLIPLVVVSLGYHGDADHNAALPKSRLPAETVFSRA